MIVEEVGSKYDSYDKRVVIWPVRAAAASPRVERSPSLLERTPGKIKSLFTFRRSLFAGVH